MLKKSILATTLLFVAAVISVTASQCGQCLQNGIACYNETSFQLCLGAHADIIDTSHIYPCPTDQVCTGLSIACVPKSQFEPVCSPAKGCGVCGTGAFACTSRSTFGFCSGSQLTDVRGKCPNGLVCDVSTASTSICVSPCLGSGSCNIPDPVV